MSIPSGFFKESDGTMLRTRTPLASYSLMMPPPEPGAPGNRTLAMYQWSVPGMRTMVAGVGAPGVGNDVLVGGVVTRWSAFAQSASLVGTGGEYFHFSPAPVSAT